MSDIRNTAAETNEDPTGFIVQALTIGSTDAILLQEAAGQREVVNSTAIPVDMHSPREEFEALGFVLGEVRAGDPLFRDCTLPAGWYRDGSDHSMWSYICDERGFRRVNIFYKAAFYDRSAHVGIQRNPTTRAQDDSYDAFAAWCPYEDGWKLDSHKDGDNLVRVGRECRTDERGSKVFDHEAREWAYTGRTRSRVVAPDGSVLEEFDSETSA